MFTQRYTCITKLHTDFPDVNDWYTHYILHCAYCKLKTWDTNTCRIPSRVESVRVKAEGFYVLLNIEAVRTFIMPVSCIAHSMQHWLLIIDAQTSIQLSLNEKHNSLLDTLYLCKAWNKHETYFNDKPVTIILKNLNAVIHFSFMHAWGLQNV